MIELAEKQDGFLGIESASDEVKITVSYWEISEAIQYLKLNLEHIEAREKVEIFGVSNLKLNWYYLILL